MGSIHADTVLLNGKIITVDPHDSIVDAVAVLGDRIVAVGSNDEVKRYAGPETKVIDLKGKTAMPGIIDSHTHPTGIAEGYLEVNCRAPPVRNIKDIQDLVEAKVKELGPGVWIQGSAYNDSKLEEKRQMTRWELDVVAPENPVMLTSDTGHQCIVNSLALEIAGISKDSQDPPGGEYDRDDNGEPTGLIYEMAQGEIRKHIPPYTVAEIRESYKKVVDQFSKWGITSTHNASARKTGIRAYKQLLDMGVRQVRMRLMVSVNSDEPGGVVDALELAGIEGLGIMMTDEAEIERLVLQSHDAGLRVSIHSIGDRGVDVALDAIEKAQKRNLVPDMRHRLEHNSLCTPKQLKRIKEMGVIPSSSIGYMYGLGDQYAENFGEERCRWLHPHRTMKEMGIIAGGNSDCPVTYYSPFVQMYAAVTRKSSSGQVVGPEEAIEIMDAIRVYTWNGAYMSKEEDKLGSIELGKLADIIVLDRDILTIDPEDLLNVQVLTTMVDGKIVYETLQD
jgi:predicted amidohydrolase YtcJ